MKINTNTWNTIRYTVYTPVYDIIAGIFRESRKKSIDSLQLKSGDKILIIGAGTGLDLEFLPKNCEITATDLTPSMVDKIKKRNKELKLNLTALVMDGQALDFPDNYYDAIVLHLILAVLPDPIKCLQEAERVLKPEGQVAVFDKFVAKGGKISKLRKITNVFTNLLFSDITRDFESIKKANSLEIISDTNANFNGNFRLILLQKM